MKVTVFTPTYNRAYILPRTYESLKKQTCKDFVWIVMDDGSVDNTKELFETWINEGVIQIHYYYQNNMGRYVAYNHARKYFMGDLVVFLDSDDLFLPDCIEKIIKCWNDEEDKGKFSGILALMETTGNKLIGTKFPKGLKSERIYVLYDKYHMLGDKLVVLRKDLAQKYKYPVYSDEKFTGDSIVFNSACDEHPLLLLNEPLMFREYLIDGLTNNLMKNHIKSPLGMCDHYKDCLVHEKVNKTNIIKHCIGYISYCKFVGKNFQYIIKTSPKKMESIVLYIPGCIFCLYLKRLAKKI